MFYCVFMYDLFYLLFINFFFNFFFKRINSHLPHGKNKESYSGYHLNHHSKESHHNTMNNSNAHNSSSSNDSHHHYQHSHGNNSSHHHHNNNNTNNNHIHHNLSSHILSFTSNLTQPFSNFLSHSTNSVLHQNNPNSFSSSNITNNTSYLNVDSTIKTIHNSISCHELHLKHNSCHSGTNPIGFHFHLAGFIDPDAGT